MAKLRQHNNLLVSVRDATEALIVNHSSVEILDIKDPNRGPLGRADPHVIRDILQIPSPSTQLNSVAMGELCEIEFDVKHWLVNADPSKKLNFAKIGLANYRDSLISLLLETVKTLPTYVIPVICAYADMESANSPSLESTISIAVEASVPMVLIDTFDKSAGCFFDYVNANDFNDLNELALSKNVELAIAGSLRRSNLKQAIELSPKIIGVRGAACSSQNRNATITKKSLSGLLDSIASVTQTCFKN